MGKEDWNIQSRKDKYLEVLSNYPHIKEDVLKTFSDYRNQKQKEIPAEQELYILAIAVPLVGFVNWVLSESIKDERKIVYFLSRDGYQPYLIAGKMIEKLGLDIECRYLNVSRISMRIPSYRLDIDKSIDSICVGGIDVTPVSILKRGGLNDEECERVLKETSQTDITDKILNYREILALKEEFKKSGLLKECIKKYSDDAYEDAIGYLKQEGLCDSRKIAIVDSGWIGTLQQSIETLVKCVNPNTDLIGYYFGLYEFPKGMNHKAFYFSPSGEIRRKARFSNSLFEAVVSSNEGMTLRYTNENGKFHPVFNDAVNPNQIGIGSNIEVLFMFSDILKKESFNEPDLKLIEKLFDIFMASPSEFEVENFGNYRFSDDATDKSLKKVVADLSVEDIRN